MKAASVMLGIRSATRACIVGVGGLGCPASHALAQAGVGSLTLLDPDVVDVTNLHRQPWHHTQDVGRAKVDSAAEKLRQTFPHLEVATQQTPVTALNAVELFSTHDVVIDATDSVDAKFLMSDVAVKTGTTLVYAGVLRFEGLALRIERGGPCLRCLFETLPTDVPTCAQAGVLGSMAGVMGGLQAVLALGRNEKQGEGLLHVIDAGAMSARTVRLRRRPDCVACGAAA